MVLLRLSFTILLIGLAQRSGAQNGLQVEFEQGFPLPPNHGSQGPTASLDNGGVAGVLDDQSLEWRLPRDVLPIEYDLTITPILNDNVPTLGADFTAPGEVRIVVRVVNPTNKIVLHSSQDDCTINEALTTVTRLSTGVVVPSTGAYGDHQFYTLTLASELEANEEYEIHFTFVADVKQGLDGLYRSSYLDPISQQIKWIASTQMEALHARQMFPCFDEPAFKAIFYIKIGRRNDRIALACTESFRNQTMPGMPGWTFETFAPTKAMSTYLLAIIVSEFTFNDAPPGIYSKQVRTYAPKHYIERGGGIYAAEKAAELLRFFENYYVERYPLQKMDSAAVPAFFFGAMENYGLNIYRETALLYFPDESTEAERFSITRILAHELGHQWFGNLVSPRWWTHIWLNEGFATYVAAQGALNVSDEFQPWERFQNDAVQYSMSFDSRSDYSHSVKIDDGAWGTRPAMDWFDRMAYEKAGSLILMMNGFMSEGVMQQGQRTYLNAMQFNASIQDDLFEHFNMAAKAQSKIPNDLTIKDIMDTWTLQPGFPLLRVSVADAEGVLISQERFLNNEVLTEGHISQDGGLWFVPMAIATKAQPTSGNTTWIYKNIAVKRVPANTSEWVVVNSDANGYYRVIYDAKLTQLIKQELAINPGFVPSRTRSQLFDDYFSAAWQKHINIETTLSLLEYLGNEEEIVVWNTVLTNLRKPFNLLSGTGSFYASLRSFLLPRLKSAMDRTGGLENGLLPDQCGNIADASILENCGMKVIRHLQFMDWLCGFEDPQCLDYSSRLVNQWMGPPVNNTIRRDIKPVAYCSAIASGTDVVFDFIHKQYGNINTSPKQRGTLLNSLACTKDIALINKLLEGTLSDDGFYFQRSDATTAMQALARNPLGRTPVLRFLRQNADEIISRLGASSISSVITTLANYISTQTELNDIQNFLVDYPTIQPVVATAVKTIQDNIIWVKDFGTPLSSYLKSV